MSKAPLKAAGSANKPLKSNLKQRWRQRRYQARQHRYAELRRLSAQQAPLQIEDHLLIPVVVIFIVMVVGLALWWFTQ